MCFLSVYQDIVLRFFELNASVGVNQGRGASRLAESEVHAILESRAIQPQIFTVGNIAKPIYFGTFNEKEKVGAGSQGTDRNANRSFIHIAANQVLEGECFGIEVAIGVQWSVLVLASVQLHVGDHPAVLHMGNQVKEAIVIHQLNISHYIASFIYQVNGLVCATWAAWAF